MKYTISFAGLEIQGGRLAAGFRVDRPDAELVCVVARVPVGRAVTLFRGEGGKLDESAFALAVGRWALPRIEAGIVDGTYELLGETERTRSLPLDMSGSELDTIAADLSQKRCRYQAPAGADLFCNAGFVDGDPSDDLARLKGLPTSERAKFPTSIFLCSTCTLPDDRVICSRLHHAMVQRADHPTESSMFALRADCDLGRKDSSPPAQCHFLGHECWQRTVETVERQSAAQASPLALHESVDYFDAVWRDVMRAPLLKFDVLAVGGMLATPCAGRDDFLLKVSSVVDAFDGFQVPGKKHAASLDRLAEYLRSWSASRGAADEDLAALGEAVGVLKKVTRLRAGLLHGGDRARGDFEEAQRVLGVSLPSTSYAEEWNRLVVRVASALAAVRQHVRKYGRNEPSAPPEDHEL